MARTCSICEHPNRKAIEQKVRSGTPYIDIERWLATTEQPASRMAISRHAAHAGLALVPRAPGPRPASGNFLRDVVGAAADDLAAGILRPSVRDGIAAQAELNRADEKMQDRDLLVKWAQLLGGAAPAGYIEGSYREVPQWEKDIDDEIAGLVAQLDGEPALLPATTTADKPWRDK